MELRMTFDIETYWCGLLIQLCSNAAFATSKFLNMWAEQGGWQEELSELQQTNVRSCFVQSAR